MATNGVSGERDSVSRLGRLRYRELRVAAWLGAGVVGVGIGASALGGAAIGHADADTSTGASNGSRANNSALTNPPRSPRAAADVTRAARGSVSPAAATAATRPSGGASVSSVKRASRAAAAAPRRSATNQTSTAAAVVAPERAASTAVQVPSAAASAPTGSATGNAVGWYPGLVISIFVSNGTAAHPNAGLLIGNGFSFDQGTCANAEEGCDGGRAGFLYGNGGNGYGGGNGGSAGLIGNGGNAAVGIRYEAPPDTQTVRGGNGGHGGLLFGDGGVGGPGAPGTDGGAGGWGGLFFGAGGRGGPGGGGTLACSEPACTLATPPGKGGRGGRGGLLQGRAADGAEALPSTAPQFIGFSPTGPAPGYPAPFASDDPQSLLGGFFPGVTVGATNYGPTRVCGSSQASDCSERQNPADDAPVGAADPTVGENRGFPNPYGLNGTFEADVAPSLPAGFEFARFADGFGSFLAPNGTAFGQISVPPLVGVQPYFRYVVVDPALFPANYHLQQSILSPGFGVPGGGIQYVIYQGVASDQPIPDANQRPVTDLIASGYLAYLD